MKKLFPFVLIFLSFAQIAYSFFSLKKIISTSAPDFSVYFTAAFHILHGQPLYTDTTAFTFFAYPPLSALLFLPFAALSYSWAQAVFLVISFLASILCVFLSAIILNSKSKIVILLITGLFLLSFPAKFTLGMGQVNFVALSFLLGSFWLFQKKQLILSGILFALCCVAKPVFGFFVFFYLFSGAWIVVASATLTGGVIVGSSFLLPHAFSQYQYYAQYVVPHLFTTNGREVYYNQGLLGFISRLTPNLFLRQILNTVLSFIILAGAGVKVFYNRKNYLFTASLILCVLPLIDTLSWQHHFIVLLFPIMYLATLFIQQKQWKSLLALGGGYFLVASNIAHPSHFTGILSLILSHVFYGTLIIFILLILQKNQTVLFGKKG